MKFLRLVFLVICFPSVLFAHEYFPWEASDHATYLSVSSNIVKKSEVKRTSREWRLVSNFAGLGEQWVYAGDTKGLYLYRKGAYARLPDHTFSVGSSATVNLGGCHDDVTLTLYAKDLTVSTPAGTFDDVIELKVSGSDCRDAGVTSIWLAKGVGVIRWRSLTIAGPESFDLKEAKIARVQYPSAQGLTVSASFPNRELKWVSEMSLSASIKVTNDSSESMTYEFSSGKQFDIVLLEASSQQVVQRFSDGKAYIQALTQQTIKPGESLHLSGDMTLSADVGPGDYEIRVELTSWQTPHTISSTLKLR